MTLITMDSKILLLYFLSFASSTHGKLWTTNSTIGMAVKTTSGNIVGHANHDFPYVSEYLGIPFAEPPVTNLRFMPPQPYACKSETLIANKQPLSCPQPPSKANYSQPPDWINKDLVAGTASNHTSEDCLYMNVWTKYPYPGTALKPVMVWIFGGGFHSGGASDATEQGAILAEQQDVVAVNFNYRLGIFGFPGAPNTRQNLGLLDQRLAIEWVRNNIASFGGDPERITIYGHSAGGASADYYNFAWTEDPIISGSIIMSGNVLSFANRFANTSAAAWYTASNLVGCGNSSIATDADILSCMRSKDANEFIKISQEVVKLVSKSLDQTARGYEGITGAFGPTNDEITVFSNYTDRAHNGHFIQRPILTGSNDDEACFFAMEGQIPVSDEDVFTAVIFTCPTYHTAQYRINAHIPAWKYRYFGRLSNYSASSKWLLHLLTTF